MDGSVGVGTWACIVGGIGDGDVGLGRCFWMYGLIGHGFVFGMKQSY